VQPRLHGLGVPVTEVVERQVVELGYEMREVELAEETLELALRLRETREDPALLERLRALFRRRALRGLDNQARDVPELVRELAALIDRAFGETHVLRRGHLHQPVAHRVRAVPVDHRQRAHTGPEA